jgi:formylglycine-generating enzyme required for sulfatase activity
MLRVGTVVLIAFVASYGAAEKTQVRSRLNAKDGQTYIWVPAGTFTMGCSESDTQCYAWEMSPKQERIDKGFWIGKTEVTQKAFSMVTGKNPSRHQGPLRPVEQVSWNDAKGYCEAIGMRLPTEAEWEYAARGGSKAPYYGKLEDIAWFNVNVDWDESKEVAKRKPNAFGLYDMLGNVWEWVDDLYGDKGNMHVLRGGSFLSSERDLRVSNRAWAEPDAAYRYFGFRCVSDEAEP